MPTHFVETSALTALSLAISAQSGDYLPEDRVKVGAVELIWQPSRRQLGSQEGHELFKVNLSVACEGQAELL